MTSPHHKPATDSTSTPTEVPMPLCSRPLRSRSSRASAKPPTFRERRTLTLKSFFHGLSKELDRLAPRYAANPPAELSAFPTLPDLLARLTDAQARGTLSHGSLVCSVVAIHQSTPHRLWVAILLRSFRPMIRRIFKKLVGADREERLALLLTSFQEAVRRVDPRRDPLRIGMYLKQATRRGVFAELRQERDWEEIGFGTEADEEPDSEAEARALATEWLKDTPDTDRELIATAADHGALWALVQRAHPAVGPAERLRIYRQLRYRRKQLLAELREHLGLRSSAAASSGRAAEVSS
jgi:hypothetical protein